MSRADTIARGAWRVLNAERPGMNATYLGSEG